MVRSLSTHPTSGTRLCLIFCSLTSSVSISESFLWSGGDAEVEFFLSNGGDESILLFISILRLPRKEERRELRPNSNLLPRLLLTGGWLSLPFTCTWLLPPFSSDPFSPPLRIQRLDRLTWDGRMLNCVSSTSSCPSGAYVLPDPVSSSPHGRARGLEGVAAPSSLGDVWLVSTMRTLSLGWGDNGEGGSDPAVGDEASFWSGSDAGGNDEEEETGEARGRWWWWWGGGGGWRSGEWRSLEEVKEVEEQDGWSGGGEEAH